MTPDPRPTMPDVSGHEPEVERRQNDHHRQGSSLLRRWPQGVTAAGLTAAGLAAGVVLESRTKLSRKLPIAKRRKRARALPGALTKRLR